MYYEFAVISGIQISVISSLFSERHMQQNLEDDNSNWRKVNGSGQISI